MKMPVCFDGRLGFFHPPQLASGQLIQDSFILPRAKFHQTRRAEKLLSIFSPFIWCF